MNPRSEWFKRNTQSEEFRPRIQWDWKIGPDSFGFKVLDRLGWDGLIFNRITSNEIENFFRIDSEEFGLARKQISKWIFIQNFYQGEACFLRFISFAKRYYS